MNAEEEKDVYISDPQDSDEEIYHFGTPRHSGRYPWGSGKNPYQHSVGFLHQVRDLRDKGMSDVEISSALGFSSINEFREKHSIAVAEREKHDVSEAIRLKEKGLSNTEIGKRLGRSESTIRNYLKKTGELKKDKNTTIATALKDQVKTDKYIDVGKGTNLYLGVSQTRLNTILKKMQEEEGYNVYTLRTPQMGTGKNTTLTVLTAPDVSWKEMYEHKANINPIGFKIEDGGHGDVTKPHPPKQISSKRVYIRYNEDGGLERDGTIELRRGVEDLDMGGAKYAQVRIGLDGTHYLKGMAVYSDDVPEGYDIIFNTNKHKGTPPEKVFKEQDTKDPLNPFGALIKPGGQRGALNIVREEGDWSTWSKNLPSQLLSKQPEETAKRQLDLATSFKQEEFDKIMSITNDVVRKKMLIDFADECDSDAVNLKAAAMPRQATHVILPVPSLSETEVYAPGYKDGERVALVRFPHGGQFEIPELTVNNKNKEGKAYITNSAIDAIGINPKVAEQLSGADFDGDTVLVIPNNNGAIKSKKPLQALKDFDPKEAYPHKEGQAPGWKKGSATEHKHMGDVSNLITDMTLKGADDEEIAAAVRHSMVIIDTAKHGLDWKSSYYDNNIPALKKKYQGAVKAGASTLISRASSQSRLPGVVKPSYETPAGYSIDPKTGQKIWQYKRETYINKRTGKEEERHPESTKMYDTEDARDLLSDKPTRMEMIYADYANSMKALGNKARKEYLKVNPPTKDPEAAKKYSAQVSSLDAKLNEALKNAPLERKAQLVAKQLYDIKLEDNPDMSKDEKRKQRGKSLTTARELVGAAKQRVYITDEEWEAIQNNAITKTKLQAILNNANNDRVMELVMPHKETKVTPAIRATMKNMIAAGYTLEEVADHFNVSVSEVSSQTSGKT